MLRRYRVKRTRKGTFKLDLPSEERDALRSLFQQLRQLLADDGAAPAADDDGRARRLFPTAYASDDAAEAEYQRLMRSELVASRLEALDLVEATLDAGELSAEQLQSWMASLNAVRLVLGTLLDVAEDDRLDQVAPTDPNFEGRVLYGYLSMLLDEMVDAALG
jgi:hypothetical protein